MCLALCADTKPTVQNGSSQPPKLFSCHPLTCPAPPRLEQESDEAAAARQQRVSAALKEYRKTLGLDVDPAVEAAAQVQPLGGRGGAGQG